MNIAVAPPETAPALREALEMQRHAFLAAPPRSYGERIADLNAIGR